MKGITQTPHSPNEWLYQDQEDGNRLFTDYVIRPENTPVWAECTTAEKEQWEADHAPEVPEIVEPQTEEAV